MPGDGPPGHLGVPGGMNDVVAQAPPLPRAAGRICQGALWKEGDAGWPSLPPVVMAVPAATMPTTARRRQRRAAAALCRNAAKVAAAMAALVAALAAGFSGTNQGAFGTLGGEGDASLGTLAP